MCYTNKYRVYKIRCLNATYMVKSQNSKLVGQTNGVNTVS